MSDQYILKNAQLAYQYRIGRHPSVSRLRFSSDLLGLRHDSAAFTTPIIANAIDKMRTLAVARDCQISLCRHISHQPRSPDIITAEMSPRIFKASCYTYSAIASTKLNSHYRLHWYALTPIGIINHRCGSAH